MALDRTCPNCNAYLVCTVQRGMKEAWDELARVSGDTPLDRGTWKTKTDRLTARACGAYSPDPRYE